MRVLHITSGMTAELGGPPRVVGRLSAALAARGAACHIYAPHPEGEPGPSLPGPGVELTLFRRGWLAGLWPGHSPDLERAVEEAVRDFDVVHIHEMWNHPHYAAARAARRAGVPFVVSVHGELSDTALGQRRLKKWVYTRVVQRRLIRAAAAVHAMTEAEAQDASRYGAHGLIRVIPNGVDMREFAALPDRAVFERERPGLAGSRVVLYMGRLHEKKGLDLLVDAFAATARERPDMRLVIAGPDYGYGDTLRRLIGRAGIEDRTCLTGMLDDGQRLAALSRADVFALPSLSEGFSMAILEALAAGCPVVITRECNFPEVGEAGAGIIVRPDAVELAGALARLADDGQARATMSRRARALVRERFTWDRIAGQFLELYAELTRPS